MSSSPVYVLMQPKIRNSYWFANILQGINRALVKYRDTLCVVDSSQINTVADPIYSLYKKPVLVIGNDIAWIDDSINALTVCGAVPILVNACMLPIHRSKCNGIVFELEEAMQYCVKYFRNAGRCNTAFLGANSHSVSDISKCRALGGTVWTFTQHVLP